MACASLAPAAWASGPDEAIHANRTEAANPFRGSTLTVDQSVTTQTTELGPAAQSYVPLYELWISFRPAYWFDDHWSVRGRFDYSKELTNAESTTYYREDVLGDIWTDLAYSAKLDALWANTRATLALRALWPASKASQAAGTYVALGAVGSVVHTFELRGQSAAWLPSVRLGLLGWYEHPFTTATTPTSYGGFSYVRENVDGASFVSDQVQGQTVVAHQLVGLLDAQAQVTPKLSIEANLIFIDQWHYPPPTACVATLTGCAPVGRPNDEQFTQETWFLLDADYALFDELDVGVGYYNLANLVAPDGTRRSLFGSDNIWWSPDARFFFDVTGNLDAAIDDALGHKYRTREAARAARRQRIASELR